MGTHTILPARGWVARHCEQKIQVAASASEAGSQGCGALCEDTKRLGSVSVGLFWPVMAVLTANWGASTASLATWALARRETPHRRCAGHSGQCLAFARCAEHRSRACAR